MKKLLSIALAFVFMVTLLPVTTTASEFELQGQNTISLEVFSEDGHIEMTEVPESTSLDFPEIYMSSAPPSFEVVKLVDNGPDDKNLVITIMGDGFTAGEQNAFLDSAKKVGDYIFTQNPFSSFKDHINIYAIKVISAASGAADNPKKLINNYFGSSFRFDGKTDRLLYVTYVNKVYELLNYYTPLYNVPVVLVNSSQYGGGGGAFAVVSLEYDVCEGVLHEMGHSVGGLADEYWYKGEGRVGAEAPNVTQDRNPETIKWKTFLGVKGYDTVGIYPFEASPSWYRPSQACRMQFLYCPYCEVCAAQFAKVITSMANEPFYGRSDITSTNIPDGTTQIGAYTYYGSDNLTSVIIPGSVESIGRYAFLRCVNLTNIINLAATPQNITKNDVFYGVNRLNVELFVPEGTKDAYLAAGWTGFKDILELSDEQSVAVGSKMLTWNSIKWQNDFEDNVRTNLALPGTGVNGTTVTWAASNAAVISGAGVVSRPNSDSADVDIDLTATISKGSKSATVTFSLTVKRERTDEEAVQEAKAAITWDAIRNVNIMQKDVKAPLNLQTNGLERTIITWESSQASVIAADGKVYSPKRGSAEVTLTATVTRGAASDTVVFLLIVRGNCIDYSGADLIVPCDTAGFSINLTKEAVITPNQYTIAAYSLDGAKWVPVKSGKEWFPNLLNKDLTLHLTDNYDASAKKPGKGAKIVVFPKINKRAAAPKVVVNYAIGADSTGHTPGDWVLSESKGETAVKDNIQIGLATVDIRNRPGNVVDYYGYGKFYAGETNGILIKELPSDGKVLKTTYFIRTEPKQDGDVYTAASKPKRIVVTSENKPPNYKVNYKTESIKLKKDDLYAIGDGSFTAVDDAKGITLELSTHIDNGAAIYIKTNASAKKAATATAQTIVLLPRATLFPATLALADGKLKLDKKYEVMNPKTGRWGSVPKVTTDTVFAIRLKPTAKLTKGAWIGNAASAYGTLKITWGTLSNGKSGITEAIIIP